MNEVNKLATPKIKIVFKSGAILEAECGHFRGSEIVRKFVRYSADEPDKIFDYLFDFVISPIAIKTDEIVCVLMDGGEYSSVTDDELTEDIGYIPNPKLTSSDTR